MGHSFGSSQVLRLAAHVEAEEAARRHVARKGGDGEDHRSEILGLVLLASAYHVPDGGNAVFALPLPVLTLIKPIISQVRCAARVLGVGVGSVGRGGLGRATASHLLTYPPPTHTHTHAHT